MVILFANLSFAHGMNKVDDKTILFRQHDSLLIKVEMTPNSVNYNTTNSLVVSIIDQEAGRFHQRPASVRLMQTTNKHSLEKKIIETEFNNGLFKSKLRLKEGGPYKLQLNLGDDAGHKPLEFQFQLSDNRFFARTALIITLAGILLVLVLILFASQIRKKAQTQLQQ
jgi:hypothetical protein